METKIAFFLPTLGDGGVGRQTLNLAKIIADRGYSVDLLLVKSEGPFLQRVPSNVNVVDFKKDRSLKSLPNLIFYLRQEKPIALISALSYANIIAIWAKILARASTKVIVTERLALTPATEDYRNWRDRILPLIMRRTYSGADAIVANSEDSADDLARVIGIPRERIHVIYNPTFDDTILDKAKESLDHPWFREGEPPVILGVGRLTRQKDFGTLLKAFALVHKEIPARLMILGEGEDRAKLETLAKELGIAEYVELLGFVENPYKYMALANVFVLSSRYEGLPNALIEAVALKTPVVSTNCPSGPREILLDGIVGPLVQVGDFEALAREILNLLKDENRAVGFVKEGQKYLERFRPETCLNKYLKLALSGKKG